MHVEISISRGKHIVILLRNLTTMKDLTALQDKDIGHHVLLSYLQAFLL